MAALRTSFKSESGLKVTNRIRGLDGTFSFYDETHAKTATLADAILKLSGVGGASDSWEKHSYDFEKPTFIDTDQKQFPRLKILGIKVDVKHTLVTKEIKFDAGEVVAMILKDLFEGREFRFDHGINLQNEGR